MWDPEQGLNSPASPGLFPWGTFTIHIAVLDGFSRDHHTTTICRKAIEIVNNFASLVLLTRQEWWSVCSLIMVRRRRRRERGAPGISRREERTVDVVAAVYRELSSSMSHSTLGNGFWHAAQNTGSVHIELHWWSIHRLAPFYWTEHAWCQSGAIVSDAI